MMLFAARYAYQIYKREINPTLSTWIIFILGTGLSLITYAIAEKHDFRSGILKYDGCYCGGRLCFLQTIAWGNRNIKI